MSCADFLKKYSGEARLIPLSHIAVHTLNRKGAPLNGQQVKDLLKRWDAGSKAGGEDFSIYRYKPARVVEPNPSDRLAYNRHTNSMADIDPMIRPVSKDYPCYGVFAKSHCWAALWGMTGRGIQKGSDPDSVNFCPPGNQPDLKFTEENGMWCEVVAWEGVRDHEKVFIQLMESENFDSSQALPTDEVALLRDIMERLKHKLKPRTGEREYDALEREILACPGQIFTSKDIECRYNIAKVLGTAHIDFLTQYCTVYVQFKTITVPGKLIQALTKLPAACPWCKIALLLDNYDTLSPQVFVAGKGIADNWNEATIREIAQHWHGKPVLQEMDALVGKLLDAYRLDKWPGQNPERLHRMRCNMVKKVGQTLRKKNKDEWRDDFFEIESSLRKKLPSALLGPPVVPDCRSEEQKSKSETAASSQRRETQVDEVPALKFDSGGKVCEDMALEARQKGLAVGSICQALKDARGIKRDCFGVIVGFGERDVKVKFDADEDEEEKTVYYSLRSLVPSERPAQNEPEEEAEAEEEMVPPEGIAWQSYDEITVAEGTIKQLSAFNDRLAIQQSPTEDQVCVLEDPRVLVAKKDLPPETLKLVPVATTLTRLAASTQSCPGEIDVILQMSGQEPVLFSRELVAPYLGRMVGTKLTVQVAEFVAASSAAAKAHTGGFATLKSCMSPELGLPMSLPHTTDDKNWKHKTGKTHRATLSAKFRHWTNAETVKMGQALAFPETTS